MKVTLPTGSQWNRSMREDRAACRSLRIKPTLRFPGL